jgi:hypothetical protein
MKHKFVLHSPFPTYAVADALRQTIDEERITLFSLSGYKGKRPLLGKVGDHTFRLQKRRYYKNSFAPFCYGEFEPEAGGTRIEAHFDMSRWVRYFMQFWMAVVILLGGAVFVSTMEDILRGGHYIHGQTWMGILVPLAMVLFGVLLPRIGRLLGRGEERFMLEYLQQTLAARVEPPDPVSI